MRPRVILFAILALAVATGLSAAAPPPNFKDAAKQPLRDLNMVQDDIPQVLLDAAEAPYALPRPFNCAQIIALIDPLDDALGPDLDAPPSAESGLLTRGHGLAVDAARTAAGSVIPFRSWVRKISGADRYDKTVRAAIDAGGVRRAFLKGLGQARNCRVPAAPRTEALGVQAVGPIDVPVQGGRRAPRYPIR